MPITTENVRAIKAWEQAEGTAAHFNPLATTQGGFAGETQFNSVGVKNYVDVPGRHRRQRARSIQNGLYTNILAALRAGNNADAVADAIRASPWGTGGLVEQDPRAGQGKSRTARGGAQRGFALGNRLAQDLGDRLHLVDAARDLAAERERRFHVAAEVEVVHRFAGSGSPRGPRARPLR